MIENWSRINLGTIAEIEMGQSPPGSSCNMEGIGIPLLNGPTEFGEYSPKPIQYTTNTKKHADKYDILFCVRGSTTGKMNWADQKYAIGRGLASIKHKKGSDYRYYLKAILEYFLPSLMASATGSTFPNISKDQLLNFKCNVPPLSEQKAIAHILGSLDDKIELNRQMNETLEEMARAIFKSWFVDFDPVRAKAEGRDTGLPQDIATLFPDSFENSPLGLIPKGWEVKPLSQIINIIGGGTPKTDILEYWNGDIPWFSIVDAPTDSDIYVINTEKKITQKGLENSAVTLLCENTTIISARGTVGKCALVGIPMAINQSCYGIRAKNGHGEYFTYFTIKNQIGKLQQAGHGSVFNTITRDTFNFVKIATPSNRISQAFDRTIHFLMSQILNNLNESKTLSIIRDTLLPKLISGEIRLILKDENLNRIK